MIDRGPIKGDNGGVEGSMDERLDEEENLLWDNTCLLDGGSYTGLCETKETSPNATGGCAGIRLGS